MTGKECHCEELSPCHCEELSPAVIARRKKDIIALNFDICYLFVIWNLVLGTCPDLSYYFLLYRKIEDPAERESLNICFSALI
jgi:hypothetical protein